MKHPIRRRLIYLAFQGLRLIVQCLPLTVARAVGSLTGSLAYAFLRKQRALALSHLELVFGPTMTPAQRRAVVHRMFRNLGKNGIEWLQLPRWSPEKLKALVNSEGVEELRQALALGRGAIIVSGHFGNWELMPLYLRSLGFEGEVLARRLRYPEYESFFINMRKRFGMNTLLRGSLKDVARLLKERKIVGMLPDQDTDSLEGIFVDFLGRPAYTSVGPAALSVLTGAPIVPVFNVREGQRFRLLVQKPILPPEGLDRLKAIEALTQAWSNVLADFITRFPDHWVWMHRRWKTQPSTTAQGSGLGAQKVYPQPRFPLVFAFIALSLCGLSLIGGGCAKKTPMDKSAGNAPDQQMSGFTLTGYQQDGTKKWQLVGEGATVDDNIVSILKPNAVGFDAVRKTYLTASAAQVNQNTRAVRMENDVTIHTSDGLWFFTQILHWIPDKNEVATDQAVRIEADHMLLRGRGFSGKTELKEAIIASDIEMVLNPSDHELAAGQAQQVTITCEGPLNFDYAKGIATFHNNVHVKDPNGDLYSDTLVAYLNQDNHTVRYAEAIGHVRIHQNQNTALSEKAVYEPAIGKMTLLGKPSLLIYPENEKGSSALSLGGLMEPARDKKIPLPHQSQMEPKPAGS